MRKLIILLVLGVVLIPALAFSESAVTPPIPHLINYQGMLTDNSGNPLTGNFDIIFKIYNDASAGTMRWQETQSGVTVTNGLFSVILGSVTPIDLAFDEEYWLDITVGGEHMPSRLKFTSVGYAYRAQKADTAAYAISVPQADLDSRYVNVNGPDSIRGTSSTYMFRIKNYGTGDGIQIYTPASGSGDGLAIDSAGDNGIEITDTRNDGIQIDGAHRIGMNIRTVDSSGVYIYNPGRNAIHIQRSGRHAIQIDSSYYNGSLGYATIWIPVSGGSGVWIDTTMIGDGFYAPHTAGYGIYTRGRYGNNLASSNSSYYGLTVRSAGNATHGKGLYVYGDVKCSGSFFSGAAPTSGYNTQDGFVQTYGIQSQKNELMISGTGALVGGVSQVVFEKSFAAALSSDAAIKVIVTPTTECNGVFITNKSTDGFTVKELLGGTSNAEFDWIAIGQMKPRPAEEMSAPSASEEQMIYEDGKVIKEDLVK
jgi:hypothetical protein